MNNKLEKFKNDIKNKKVAVLGIGISNTPLIKYLANLGVDITAFDKADESKLGPVLKNFEGLDVKFSLGEGYLERLKGFDVIFKTPVIRYDIPELVEARENGAYVTSEMEVFLELCPATVFGVTGSDGKTTTTTLIYEILKRHGYNCWLGGNIGTPLLDKIDQIRETDMVVVELSSFQLHTMKISPNISVITNVSPNHLDVHKSMEEYIDAKKNIYKFQKKTDKLVLNYDNDITRQMAGEACGNVTYFSRVNNIEQGMVLENGTLVYRKNGEKLKIINADEILLMGDYNVENCLAASAAVIDYVDVQDIYDVLVSFRGVKHRMEFVRELNGVKFYNNAIGTSPARTIAVLNAFKQKIILIAGGYDKHIPYDEMGRPIVDKVKHLVLMGATAPKIAKALKDEVDRTGEGKDIPVSMCSSLEEAVQVAYKTAEKGDIVVLSPASASFDMFKNFEEKGDKYKEIVNSL